MNSVLLLCHYFVTVVAVLTEQEYVTVEVSLRGSKKKLDNNRSLSLFVYLQASLQLLAYKLGSAADFRLQ